MRRALRCPQGLEQTGRDAELAQRLLPLDSLLRAPALLALGMSYLGAGAPDKAQAIAIYRKLGVSSRSQAIQRAQDLLAGQVGTVRPHHSRPFMLSG